MDVETVKYYEIVERCKGDCLELLPDLPKENTLEAWESFLDAVELVREDLHCHASEIAQNWDWSIYTHFGVKILYGLPMEIERQAEEEFFECWGHEPINSLIDSFDMASRIAGFALEITFREVFEGMAQDLEELATNQIENMESV